MDLASNVRDVVSLRRGDGDGSIEGIGRFYSEARTVPRFRGRIQSPGSGR